MVVTSFGLILWCQCPSSVVSPQVIAFLFHWSKRTWSSTVADYNDFKFLVEEKMKILETAGTQDEKQCGAKDCTINVSSLEGWHKSRPSPEKRKVQPSVGKELTWVFWDMKRCAGTFIYYIDIHIFTSFDIWIGQKIH